MNRPSESTVQSTELPEDPLDAEALKQLEETWVRQYTEEERDPNAERQNQTDLNFRAELLRQIRKLPDLVDGLGLIALPSNADILRRLKQEQDHCRMFREHGLEPRDALQLARLVPGAIRADTHGDNWCRCFFQPGSRFLLLASVFLVVACVLGALAVRLPIAYKAGFREGTCKIIAYHSGLCTSPQCTFDVEAQERIDGRLETFIYKNFAMPVKLNLHNTHLVEIASSAFRCCNPGGSMSCCDMYDDRKFYFCDNYPHLADPFGNPCPKGNWRCLFKASADEGVASELIAYEAPDALPFIVAAAVLALCCIISGGIGFHRRRRKDMIEAIPSQARSPRTPRYGKPTQSNRQLLREVYSEGVSRGEEEVIKPVGGKPRARLCARGGRPLPQGIE